MLYVLLSYIYCWNDFAIFQNMWYPSISFKMKTYVERNSAAQWKWGLSITLTSTSKSEAMRLHMLIPLSGYVLYCRPNSGFPETFRTTLVWGTEMDTKINSILQHVQSEAEVTIHSKCQKELNVICHDSIYLWALN